MKKWLPYHSGTHEQQGSKQKAVYIMELFPPDAAMKRCSKCEKFYPVTSEFFQPNKSKRAGFESHCKICQKEQNRLRYERNKERVSKRSKIYRESHKDEIRAQKKQAYEKNKDEDNARRRAYRVAHLEQEKSRSKAYRDSHKEQGRIASKRYQDTHKEEIAAKVSARQKQSESYKTYQKRYYQEHLEEIHKNQKEYYEAHKDEVHEYQRSYGKTEQGRMVSRAHKHRRKAQKRASEGSYTSQQLKEQLLRQKSRCYYCKKKLTHGWHADHVVPLSKGGSNTIENIVIACQPCNLHKSSKMPHEWIENGRLF